MRTILNDLHTLMHLCLTTWCGSAIISVSSQMKILKQRDVLKTCSKSHTADKYQSWNVRPLGSRAWVRNHETARPLNKWQTGFCLNAFTERETPSLCKVDTETHERRRVRVLFPTTLLMSRRYSKHWMKDWINEWRHEVSHCHSESHNSVTSVPGESYKITSSYNTETQGFTDAA